MMFAGVPVNINALTVDGDEVARYPAELSSFSGCG